jgi:hypothetical protein
MSYKYYSGDQNKKNETGGVCSMHGGEMRCIQETSPLGRPRSRWEDNIKMDVQEVGWRGRNWIDVAQKRDRWRAGSRERGNEHSGSTKFGKFHD